MSNRNFQRTIENFICEHCGAQVTGNGYTNHCPKCLWSKHVDVKPGDRSCSCAGSMRPIAVETKSQQSWIHHECQGCGFRGRVKISPDDDFEAVLAVARGAPKPST